MKLEVKLFARAQNIAGADVVTLDVPDDARVGDLRIVLAKQYPALESLIPHLLIAVGNDYADDAASLDGVADVACFPPVSGG
jgi:molybdopterin converting factor small subunit